MARFYVQRLSNVQYLKSKHAALLAENVCRARVLQSIISPDFHKIQGTGEHTNDFASFIRNHDEVFKISLCSFGRFSQCFLQGLESRFHIGCAGINLISQNELYARLAYIGLHLCKFVESIVGNFEHLLDLEAKLALDVDHEDV